MESAARFIIENIATVSWAMAVAALIASVSAFLAFNRGHQPLGWALLTLFFPPAVLYVWRMEPRWG